MFSDILLTVDYDRTLTAPDSTIPERNLEAIRYFMDHGGVFTVNTGRSVPMTAPFREIVPVNAPLLLYNGSACYDPVSAKLSACHEIPLSRAQTVRTLEAMFPDLTVEVQGIEAHYIFRENPQWDAFCAYNGCAWQHADYEEDLGPFLKFSLYGKFHDAKVSSLFTATEAEWRAMDLAEQRVRQQFGETCEVFRAGARIIDIHAKGVSKKRSARELQQRLGRKILVCVGDGENDVSMLQDADFAYCPADAVVADRFENVCVCAEGSVADVIYKKIPEILENKLDNRT